MSKRKKNAPYSDESLTDNMEQIESELETAAEEIAAAIGTDDPGDRFNALSDLASVLADVQERLATALEQAEASLPDDEEEVEVEA